MATDEKEFVESMSENERAILTKIIYAVKETVSIKKFENVPKKQTTQELEKNLFAYCNQK
ncbi:MAG: hypothetical protein K2H89_12090 [Oscillospiraceae bacterium]|nr:hypothetical protein [Oscillospiraceae bacterium]